jgi:hypothetical protein
MSTRKCSPYIPICGSSTGVLWFPFDLNLQALALLHQLHRCDVLDVRQDAPLFVFPKKKSVFSVANKFAGGADAKPAIETSAIRLAFLVLPSDVDEERRPQRLAAIGRTWGGAHRVRHARAVLARRGRFVRYKLQRLRGAEHAGGTTTAD